MSEVVCSRRRDEARKVWRPAAPSGGFVLLQHRSEQGRLPAAVRMANTRALEVIRKDARLRGMGQLRRRGVERDVMQMELDFRSDNDNNVYGAQLEAMDYDFNKDVDELNMPTMYPEGEDEDDV